MRRAAGRRDLDRLGEDTTGLTLRQFGSSRSMLNANTIPGFEAIADDLDRFSIGSDRMVPESRILKRRQAVTMDARFADREAASVDLVFHRHQGGRDRLSRAEMLEAATIGGEAPFINL